MHEIRLRAAPLLIAAAVCATLGACARMPGTASVPPAVTANAAATSLPQPVAPGIRADGQPDADRLRAYARAGVRTVINLRTADEPVDYDEAAVAASLGLELVHLPIRGAGDLDDEHVAAFGRALDAARAKGDVLVHCASGNRVGALVALDAVRNRAVDADAALELGRQAGLTGLEEPVRERVREIAARTERRKAACAEGAHC